MSEHRHLHRLVSVWQQAPVYFVTTCVIGRRQVLANPTAAGILQDEWKHLRERHGWTVGRYVIMPDHVHVFLAPQLSTRASLSEVMARWKQWTAKRVTCAAGTTPPLWQPEFFDHLLRNSESRSAKWEYVRENPVRAGLVARAEDWPFAGSVDFE